MSDKRVEGWNIGDEFTSAEGAKRWRVTDVGTRVIVAIELTDPLVAADPAWLNGPPYGLAEEIFDEDDQNGIYKATVTPPGHSPKTTKAIEELIEKSSLGTKEAKALRESVPPGVVDDILRRADELVQKETLAQKTWRTITHLKGALREVLEQNEELERQVVLSDGKYEAFVLTPEEISLSFRYLKARAASGWVDDKWTQVEKQRFLLDTCVRWLRREVNDEYLGLVIQKWRGKNEAVRTPEVPDSPTPPAS